MHREITLSNGNTAFVDKENYDFLMQWKWYQRSDGYAATSVNIGKSQKMMHKMIKPMAHSESNKKLM